MSVLVIHNRVVYADSKNIIKGTQQAIYEEKYAEKSGMYFFYLGVRVMNEVELIMQRSLPLAILLQNALQYHGASVRDYVGKDLYPWVQKLKIDAAAAAKESEHCAVVFGKNIVYSNGERVFIARDGQTAVMGWGQEVIPLMIESGMTPDRAIREYAKVCNMVGGPITIMDAKKDSNFANTSTVDIGRIAFLGLANSEYSNTDPSTFIMDNCDETPGGSKAFYTALGRMLQSYVKSTQEIE